MLVEYVRAGEAVGDALDEPRVVRMPRGDEDLVVDVGQQAGYPDAGHFKTEPAFRRRWCGSVIADGLAR
jgi:hypothetical protein